MLSELHLRSNVGPYQMSDAGWGCPAVLLVHISVPWPSFVLQLNAHLIEVNSSPALTRHNELDYDVKHAVVAGESFLRVHWFAVPKAMRARRVNRHHPPGGGGAQL
jgi:hypothetical protein